MSPRKDPRPPGREGGNHGRQGWMAGPAEKGHHRISFKVRIRDAGRIRTGQHRGQPKHMGWAEVGSGQAAGARQVGPDIKQRLGVMRGRMGMGMTKRTLSPLAERRWPAIALGRIYRWEGLSLRPPR